MDQPLIEIENIRKCFGSNCVLDGVTMRIYRGQITSIIGQSGMGKSVLLKHIIGLLAPDSGQVLFEGKPLSAMKKDERKILKRKFSYVFQDTALFDFLNVFENIALPLMENTAYEETEIKDRVENKLHQLDLFDIENKYPSQLSGGQRQRAAIARSLVLDPDLLLMDEPFSALDASIREDLQRLVQQFHRESEMTIIHVTHDIDEAIVLGEQILVLTGNREEPRRIVRNTLGGAVSNPNHPEFQKLHDTLRLQLGRAA